MTHVFVPFCHLEHPHMTTPRPHAQTIALMRQAWQDHLDATGGQLTQQSAEDFLTSAYNSVGTLADELQARLCLGVTEEVRVSWDERSWWLANCGLPSGQSAQASPVEQVF